MAKKSFDVAQIALILGAIKAKRSEGFTALEAIKLVRVNISESTYYYWVKKYGGLSAKQARKMEALEIENRELKKLVAELSHKYQTRKKESDGETSKIVQTRMPGI